MHLQNNFPLMSVLQTRVERNCGVGWISYTQVRLLLYRAVCIDLTMHKNMKVKIFFAVLHAIFPSSIIIVFYNKDISEEGMCCSCKVWQIQRDFVGAGLIPGWCVLGVVQCRIGMVWW